jgi:hypothetical protein
LHGLSIPLSLGVDIGRVIVAKPGDYVGMEVFAGRWIWQVGALTEQGSKEMEDMLSLYVNDGRVSVTGTVHALL